MEEVIDFDEWLANFKFEPVKYVAVYDPSTGAVKSVGPSHAFEHEEFKIDIDSEVAQSIINADIKIHNCVVDVDSQTLEFAEVKTISKIDDLLHRVISSNYSEVENNEVYLTYNSSDQTLIIELADFIGGTRKTAVESRRKIIWSGETNLVFLITSYNDPNLLYDKISVTINELMNDSKVIKNFNHKNFSIYTRRLFKHYVIENK